MLTFDYYRILYRSKMCCGIDVLFVFSANNTFYCENFHTTSLSSFVLAKKGCMTLELATICQSISSRAEKKNWLRHFYNWIEESPKYHGVSGAERSANCLLRKSLLKQFRLILETPISGRPIAINRHQPLEKSNRNECFPTFKFNATQDYSVIASSIPTISETSLVLCHGGHSSLACGFSSPPSSAIVTKTGTPARDETDRLLRW